MYKLYLAFESQNLYAIVIYKFGWESSTWIYSVDMSHSCLTFDRATYAQQFWEAKADFIFPLFSRMARRGGVKRISAVIYDDARDAIQNFLKGVSNLLFLMFYPRLIDIGPSWLRGDSRLGHYRPQNCYGVRCKSTVPWFTHVANVHR